MSHYYKFKDSKDREFEALVRPERGINVDTIYLLEDAGYLDGEKESVPEEEIDHVYDNDYWRLQTIGSEEAAS